MIIQDLIDQIDKEITKQGFEVRDMRPKPASSETLNGYEKLLGFRIPPSLREFYEIQDGEDRRARSPIFGEATGHIYQIVDAHRDLEFLREESNQGHGGAVRATGPVRAVAWSSRWIPLMEAGAIWAIDLDPPEGGKIGQIISCSMENLRNRVVAASFEALLETQLARLRKGSRDLLD
jgi:cell wall assembly regulator SMI1